MKVTYQHAEYGQIEYEEGFWSGKKELTVNGEKLMKKHKTMFLLNTPDGVKNFTVKGSFLSGTKLAIEQEEIELVPAPKWYEIACSVLIFMLILVWSNSVKLCSIVPIIGGAIGGGISGVMGCCNLLLMKKTKQIGAKLGIALGMLVATFFICYLVAQLWITLFY